MNLWSKMIGSKSNRRMRARAHCRLSVKRLEDRLAPALTFTGGTSDVTVAHTTSPSEDPVSVANPDNLPLSYTTSALPAATVVQQRYALIFGGSFYQNDLGLNEKWLRSSLPASDPNSNSAHGNWYMIFPDGSLHASTGGSTFGPTLAQLDASFWANPTNQFELASLGDPTLAGTAANLAQTYDLGFAGSYFYNYLGAGEEWLRSNLPASDPRSNPFHGGWYILFPDGTISPWDGTTNPNQSQPAIGQVNPLFWQTYPDALVTSPVAALAYTTQQNLALTFAGTYWQNFYFNNEKWLRSANGSNAAHGNWYVIFPDGTLRAWNGSTTASGEANAPVLATLTPSYWYNPNYLLMARPLLTPPASVTVTHNTDTNTSTNLVVSGYSNYVGNFGVEVTVNGGTETATGYFLFTSTDTGPLTLTNPGPQFASSGGTPQLQMTLTGGDPDNPPAALSFGAYVFSDSTSAAAFTLSQSLLLAQDPFASPGNPYDVGRFGTNYKWVYSDSGNNAAGNRYYFLTSNGELHSWDGTSTPDVSAHTLVQTFDASYYANPTRLLSPVTTATGNTSVGVSVAGNVVTYSGMTNGQTLFGVAFVTDGILTTRQTFQLTVGP
jgi:hypothetical protein